MAWLESHQSLRNHPKTLKLTRLLDIPKVAAIGHLHSLWWWALDYADDGNLTRFEALDIALGAEWLGDPTVFAEALISAGFLDRDGDELSIHDWTDFTVRLREGRDRYREANRERQRRYRERHREDAKEHNVTVTLRNGPTIPNHTTPDHTTPDQGVISSGDAADSSEPDDLEAEFVDTFWFQYPRKVDKPRAQSAFVKARKIASLATIMDGLDRHRGSKSWSDPKYIPYPSTWLNGERWNDQPDPVAPDGAGERSKRDQIERVIAMRNAKHAPRTDLIETDARVIS